MANPKMDVIFNCALKEILRYSCLHFHQEFDFHFYDTSCSVNNLIKQP